jgi:hypothetical protein
MIRCTQACDGGAISQADREFLASLSDHLLVRHLLYSVPPPRCLITTRSSQAAL